MNTSSRFGSFLLVVAVLGMTSCSKRLPSQPDPAGGPPDGPSYGPVSESEMQESLARWSNSGVDSYWYRFQWVCLCAPDHVRLVEIRVSQGVVTSVTDARTGTPLGEQEAARYRTIDGLFEFLGSSFAASADYVYGAFDPRLGYPELAYVDYQIELADEEMGFRIESLTPTR